jgi:signal recognition particle subunit SRP54
MFDSLQESLQSAIRSVRGRGKLTEANMREGLKLVEEAMLNADVGFPVVRQFMAGVTEQAIGERVLSSLDPTHQLVGIVHQELTNLMGPVDHSLHLRSELTTIMMCGLQGSGKTTTCGKLARMIKTKGRKPLLVAADLQRPAAVDQLHVLGEQIGVPVYSDRATQDPVKVCRDAQAKAREIGANVVILDTAGRLHIDDELMNQLRRVDERCHPEQVYLVVDGMTGQDAVNSAKAFNEALELDGVIMTKLDGDSRGGAALSVKAVTGVPIKFIGTGEHTDAIEEFHPDRMAQRILGMGDILTLVEQAQEKFDAEEMAEQEERLRAGEFTLDDFRKQMRQIRRLGPLQKVIGMIPGMGALKEMMGQVNAEKDFKRMEAIIGSMTAEERRNPAKVIDQSRRRRISAGAGVQPHEVNELVKQFTPMAAMMKSMAGKGIREKMAMVKSLQQGAMSNPNGMLAKQKQGTGKRLSAEEKAKNRKLRDKERRKGKRNQRGN